MYCETLHVMKISSLWTAKTIKYEVFLAENFQGLQYLLASSVLISRYSLSSLLLWWTFIQILLRGSVAKAVCSVKSFMIIIMQQEQPDDHHETHTTTTRFCSRRLHRKAHNRKFATRHVPSRRRLPDEQHSLQDDCTHWKQQHIRWQTPHRHHSKTFKERFAGYHTSFRRKRYANTTGLSKYVRQLKKNGTLYSLNWEILWKAPAYSCSSKRCNLCITKKASQRLTRSTP